MEYSEKDIQHVICLLCKANTKNCILGYLDKKQDEPTASKLICSVTNNIGTFDKNSEEVLAICEWLFTDNNFLDNEDFFVVDEYYYSTLKNAPP